MDRCWPKTVKTHNLPRLIWAAKSSRGANFFIPAIFHVTRFYGVPTTQKWPCLAKISQNTQFATFNLGCKKFARRKRYSSQPIPLLHVFTASQSCKIDHCLAKKSQNTQFATFNLGCKKFARRKLFSSQPFPMLHVFYGVPTTQKWPSLGQKKSKHTICHV